jgi:RNA polymerase sigma-70 factor (ECF subfamily)
MDDAKLVDRVLAGSQEDFARLVERHQRWVTVAALRSTRNLEEADDMAQDTFLRAYQSLATWRREAPFRAWLGQILRNRLRDRARTLGPLPEPLDAAPEPGSNPEQEQRLLDREMLAALRRAYDEMPPGRQRQVVRMRFLEGRTLAEIAAALGLQVGTVKIHLFRGARRLREQLSENEPEVTP